MKTQLIARFVFAAIASTCAAAAPALPTPWKDQDIGSAQVGKSAQVAGAAKHADGVFTLQGTMDTWGLEDGFHFVWQAVQGDVVLIARVTSMDNPGNIGHAKASLCLRESLAGGSRGVTQCITPGDGTQFTYREKTDDKTARIFPDAAAPKPSVPKGKFPCWLKLVRRGSEISGYESLDGETWWLTGTIKLDLKAAVLVGIASSSHTKTTLTTSVFDQVKLTKPGVAATAGAKSAPKRIAQLTTIGIDGSAPRVVYETSAGLEAPNWSPDSKRFAYVRYEIAAK